MNLATIDDRRVWTPRRLAGCVAWLDARRIPVGAVASTPNLGTLGGNFVQGTGTRQPTLSATAGPNSQPGLSFDGGDFLSSDLAASSWTSLHQTACAIYVVSRVASLAASYFGLLNTGNPAVRGTTLYIENRAGVRTNALGAYVHNGTAAVAASLIDNTYTVGAWQISEVLWEYGASGDDLRVVRNGTALTSSESTAVPSALAPTRSLTIGAYDAGPSNGFAGVIAELVVLSRVPSAPDRQRLLRYLAWGRGIATT